VRDNNSADGRVLLRDSHLELGGKTGGHDDRSDPRVGKLVGDLGCCQIHIDGNQYVPSPLHGKPSDHVLEDVLHQDGTPLAGLAFAPTEDKGQSRHGSVEIGE
jgi:hypothetical protein